MAKGKHSRALFEVIQLSQRQQAAARSASSPPTPAPPPRSVSAPATGSGWLGGIFKRKTATAPGAKPIDDMLDRAAALSAPPAAPGTQTDDEVDGTADETHPAESNGDNYSDEDSLSNCQTRNDADGGDAPVSVEVMRVYERRHDPEPASTHVATHESSHDTYSAQSADDDEPLPEATPPSPPRKRSGTGGTFRLNLSYPAVAIIVLAQIVLLAIAFLAGKHFARPTGIAGSGPSLAQLRSGKALPDVLNISGGSRGNVAPGEEVFTEPPTDQTSAETPPPVVDPGDLAGDTKRVIGRNYVIAQSYPDEAVALKAAELLNRNQIPVTVEQLDAAPGWFCVVTRVGFDRVQTPEFDRYLKLIRDLNSQASAARMKFEPYGYKWK